MFWSNLLKNRGTMVPESGGQLFEELESRVLLATSAFPPIGSLEDPNNTVVRIETNLGDIDIELFDQAGPGGGSAAPITTANFLNYIRDGDLDESFFHRLVSGFVLQGGGFKFDDTAGLSRVPTDDAIVNEFNFDRSNLERTLAMAKFGTDPDSATSQFFFNLADNSGPPPDLDNQNGGFTVFAHVIQGWSVVLDIAALDIENLTDFSDPLTSSLGELPVTGAFNTGDPLAENFLVEIVDIEIIKPADTTEFFEFIAYYPEGYRGPDKIETLELVNPNSDADAFYQIIVRYEIAERDTVIAFGTLKAHEHKTIVLSDFNDPTNNTVREFDPYAIEVQTSTEQPTQPQAIAASINRTDFGATTGESFFNADLFSSAQLHAWSFGGGNKTSGEVFPFIAWQNLTDTDTTVNIFIFAPGAGAPVSLTRPLEAHRRGGLNLSEFPSIPDGDFTISVIAASEMVVAMSQYDNQASKPGDQAYTMLGTPNAGQSEGALAGVLLPTNGSVELVILRSDVIAPSLMIVDFTVHLSDGSKSIIRVTIPGGNRFWRESIEGRLPAGVAAGDYVSLSYSIILPLLQPPITVHYVAEENGDAIATPFNPYASNIVHFADVFYDPAVTSTQSTVLSIFNPQAGTDLSDQLFIRIEFRFSDGTEIVVGNGTTIAALERLDVDIATSALSNMQAVRDKIALDAAFTTFAVSLAANNPLIAQLTSTNSASRNGHTSIGFYADPDGVFFRFLDDPFFDPGAGV